MDIFKQSWRRVANAITAAPVGTTVFDDLMARYSEPHRHYHSLQHLGECLATVEPVLKFAQHAAEVEIVLWFHDAIYDTQRHDNEQKSSDWAQEVLQQYGAAPAAVQRVQDLIMATCHKAVPATPDEQLVVDVDLSILGAEPARFLEYEQQIRNEYAFVPPPLFREKRGEILQAFLDRPAIYSTAHFYAALEIRARENLRHAMGKYAAPA